MSLSEVNKLVEQNILLESNIIKTTAEKFYYSWDKIQTGWGYKCAQKGIAYPWYYKYF